MAARNGLSLVTSDEVYSILVVVVATTSVLVPVFEGQRNLTIARYLVFGCSILWLCSILCIILRDYRMFQPRLALIVIIDFVLFILIGAAFRMSIAETFLLIPAIVNTGMLLSIQEFPWRIAWREERGSTDVERQDANRLAQPAPDPRAEH